MFWCTRGNGVLFRGSARAKKVRMMENYIAFGVYIIGTLERI